MSEEFRALIEITQDVVVKRFKTIGFNSGFVAGNATNPVKRNLRLMYTGQGIFVPQSIVINSFSTTYTLGANIRPSLCTAELKDRNGQLLIERAAFFFGMNNYFNWAYDNLDCGINLTNNEYLTLDVSYNSAGSRNLCGALIGIEYLLND